MYSIHNILHKKLKEIRILKRRPQSAISLFSLLEQQNSIYSYQSFIQFKQTRSNTYSSNSGILSKSSSYSPEGSSDTSLSLLFIFLVRTPISLSSSSPVCSIRFCAAARTVSNLENSVLTAPNTFQTSLDRFWIASVLNPICKLFNNAAKVVGPAIFTRYCLCNVSINPFRTTSAYKPSNGRNIIAKSVVYGGSMYLSWISFAQPLILVSRAACVVWLRIQHDSLILS